MKMKFIVPGIISVLAVGAGAAFAASENKNSQVQLAKAELHAETTTIYFGANGEVNMSSANAALHYWGGASGDHYVDMTKIGTTLWSVEVPNDAASFQILRLKNGKTYGDDGVSSVDNYGNNLTFSTSKTWVVGSGWTGDGNNTMYCDYSTNSGQTQAAKGTKYILNTSAVDWWADGADQYIYTFYNGDFYGAYAQFFKMTRIGETKYFYVNIDKGIILNGCLFARVKTDETPTDISDHTVVHNQTTDVSVNLSGGLTKLLSTGGDYNKDWYDTTDAEKASFYGTYFYESIKCSGTGSRSFTSSDWEEVSNTFSDLPSAVQTMIRDQAGKIEDGTDLEMAVYRYDYLVFYKTSYGYTDFMLRDGTPNQTQFRNALITITSNQQNNSALTITVISAISLVSIIGFLFILKKKSI